MSATGHTPNFDRHGPCPICKHHFPSADCPHSFGDVVRHMEDGQLRQTIRRIVREEVRRALSPTSGEKK